MLVLPACPASMPTAVGNRTANVLVDEDQSLADIRRIMAGCTTPSILAGACQTPTIWWLAALQQWPQAEVWLWDDKAQPAQWCSLAPHDAAVPVVAKPLPGNTQVSSPQVVNTVATETANKIQAASTQGAAPDAGRQSSSSSSSTIPACKLKERAFLLAVWGLDDKTRQHELDEIRLQAASLGAQVVQQVEEAVIEGTQGAKAWNECLAELKSRGDGANFAQWLRPWLASWSSLVQRNINVQLGKQRKFMAKKQQTAMSTFSSQVQMPDCTKHHPNSLAHLKPQPFWQILIDETGSQFGDDALSTQMTSPQLGRVVALAVPGNQNILPHIGNYHATESSHEQNDAVVQSLLAAPIGILGFTVKDQDILQAYSWLSAIHTLCRWVLRHLPVPAGQAVRVDFLIEQRGNAHADLAAVSELLMAELHRVDAERFANLKINMQFIDKTGHPYNGYVDTIAHCWGSQVAASKERLRKSAWLGHCLLRPSDKALGRLLLAIDGEELTGAEWLELMGHLQHLPDHSLAQDLLQQLGKQVAAQPTLWEQYVAEVSLQLANKHYQLAQLVPALDWLQQHAPLQHTLPALLELQWLSGKLAVINHQGQLDMTTVNRCIALALQLQQEDARLATDVILRLAVSATNSFQFALTNQLLDHLAELPDLALGWQRRGKLLSSRGQVQAFLGSQHQAVQYFDEALACFGQLSNPEQAQREQQQTGLYRLFALLDDSHVNDAQWADEAEQYTYQYLQKDLPATLRSLAYSQAPQRWLHHLFLRALCLRPALAEKYAIEYIQQEQQWQTEEFHPWPLIDFYRGWLLQLLGRGQHARAYWHSAIARCQQGGSTLQWMALVLSQLAHHLDNTLPAANADELRRLQALIPTLPVAEFQAFAALESVEQAACKTYLEQCLPFNFH